MLYPAELQALPQPRGVRLAQDFNLCLGLSGLFGLSRLSGLFGLSRVFGLETNQINKTNQINQIDETDWACLSLALYEPVRQEYFFSCRSGGLAKLVQ
jgi:hypothetical protein